MQRREREREAREAYVGLVEKLVAELGITIREAVGLLDISVRSYYRHRAAVRADRLLARPRGRRVRRADAEQRAQVYAELKRTSGKTSVATLQGMFPELPRREVRELKREWQHLRFLEIQHLVWKHPGQVWAMDFTVADRFIDGVHSRLFVVMDLASRRTLATVPCGSESSDTVVPTLHRLYQRWGAPLVIKMDNASAFRCQRTKALHAEWGVQTLYSPARRPQYNGSVEASMGWRKDLIESSFLARSGGELLIEEWTTADVEAARTYANAHYRPWGPAGPSPDERWHRRRRVTPQERSAFQERYRAFEARARARRSVAPDAELDHQTQSSIDRWGVREALVDLGYLAIYRRRLSPVLLASERANIS